MLGTQQVFETAPGIRISALVAGSGPLVILMHGWPELGLSWRHQIKPLVEAGYRVAVPDMRGYGASSKPDSVSAYQLDTLSDDMAAIARALGASKWAAIGHDWGAPVAWRCALRFPDEVGAVFALSVPHQPVLGRNYLELFEEKYAGRFFYVKYFLRSSAAEAELARDPKDALKRIFFALSGDAPLFEWTKVRADDAPLLEGLTAPPPGPLSFMTHEELDAYAKAFSKGGWRGPINWYRALDGNAAELNAYADTTIHQPAGFLCGDREITLEMAPEGLVIQRAACHDLRVEKILPGAGHWIQQERPEETNAQIIGFLNSVNGHI